MGTGPAASKPAAAAPPCLEIPERMIRPLLLLAAVAGVLAAPLPAQTTGEAVRVGARVRVTLSEQLWTVEGVRDPQVLRGVLQSLTRDSLRLQLHPGAAPVSVARSAVSRVDVSLGVPTRVESAARGALLNAAVFAGSNLLVRAVARDDTAGSTEDVVIRGAAIGAAFGAVAGAVLVRERWQRSRLPERVRVGAGATRDGAVLAASLRL